MRTPIIRLSPGLPAPLAPRRSRAPHAAGVIDQVHALVTRTTLPYREIARRTGVPRSTISRHAVRRGWLRPGTGFPEEHYTELGRRQMRRSAIAASLLARAERELFGVEMDPTASPPKLERVMTLVRRSRQLDEAERPKRRRRRAPPRDEAQ